MTTSNPTWQTPYATPSAPQPARRTRWSWAGTLVSAVTLLIGMACGYQLNTPPKPTTPAGCLAVMRDAADFSQIVADEHQGLADATAAGPFGFADQATQVERDTGAKIAALNPRTAQDAANCRAGK